MGNSKYPQELDTSVEIPPVRDNITEIGSDVINSLRSAIFRIEATLGINPQGATGSTVSERLLKSLDSNGNLKKDALTLANVLSGPIIDSDVSKVAAIAESKLKLNFPTTLLQSEISIINSELEIIRSGLESLSATFSIHVNPSSLSQHSAGAISVSASSSTASSIATLSLITGSVQDAFDEIYNSHINYNGSNISQTNNSHTADQIFYDNSDTSSVIFSDDLQGVIDDLANAETVGFRNTILNVTSNGRIRTGSVYDDYEGGNIGSLLIESTAASYIQSAGATTTTFSLTVGQTPIDSISEFDVLTLSGSTTTADNQEYLISEVLIDGSGFLQSVTVYGGPLGSPQSGLLIKISKNTYVSYNLGGFASVVRPRADKSNTPDVQILNPDSATIISSKVHPENITALKSSFDAVIDGMSAVTISAYDATATDQTIDTMVQVINDQAVDQHLNITAFKVLTSRCYELAISHNMPNVAGDSVNRTILISGGTTNDGAEELGFTSILGTTVEGSFGNSLALNGKVLSGFGLVKSLTSSTVEIIAGTLTLSLFSGSMSELGVRVGDLAIITGSTTSADDGSYRVQTIVSGTASLDLSGTLFAGSLDSDSSVHIVRATSNIGELTFEEIASLDGTIVFDTFMSEDKNLFHSKRFEVENSLRDGPFFGAVSDISRNFIISGETGSLTVSSSGFATLTGPDLQDGAPVFVGVTGTYKIFGSDGLSFLTLEVNASGSPILDQTVTIYGFDEISSNNYHLCRGGFSTTLGRVLGSSTNPGVPTLIDKRRSGTADATIVGESFIEKFIAGPRNELRGSGIIRGCLVSDVTYTDSGTEIYQNYSVGAGIAIVNGTRFEFPGQEGMRVNTDGEYYIAMDNRGCIVAKPVIDNPHNSGQNISPFFEYEVATLAEVVNDATDAFSVDLRLFVDNLDLKVIGDIKVAKDSRHGHFTKISDAVSYSKRFSKMFPEMGRPSILIENGFYEISSTILLDFDISIQGSGFGTILTKTGDLAAGTAFAGIDVDMGTSMFMIGGGSNVNSSDIKYGVSLSDFVCETDESLLINVGCMIAITQPLTKSSSDVSPYAKYNIEKILFRGPGTMNGNVANPNKVGEYAVIIGQQDSSTLVSESDLTMGNLTLTNCRMSNMGLELGAVKFTESLTSTIKDVIMSNNIITNGSPNLSDTTAVIIEYPTNPATEGITEPGNTFRVGT